MESAYTGKLFWEMMIDESDEAYYGNCIVVIGGYIVGGFNT